MKFKKGDRVAFCPPTKTESRGEMGVVVKVVGVHPWVLWDIEDEEYPYSEGDICLVSKCLMCIYRLSGIVGSCPADLED